MKVAVNNIELNYITLKPFDLISDDIILLFLHEALGSIAQWKEFPQKLCEKTGLNGIVYERQGHGNSSPFTSERTHRYLHNYAFEELPVFIQKAIPSNKKIILIGHSDGGTIALLYSHKYPEQISGIITMAAHVVNESQTIAGIAPAVDAYKKGKLAGLSKYHGEKTESLFYAWANTWNSSNFLNWNILSEIGSDHPYLCIQGMDDQYGTIEQLRLIQTKTNASLVMLENCGHQPHIEQTESIILLMTNFIKNIIKSN